MTLDPSIAIAICLLLATGLALELRIPSAIVEVLAGVVLVMLLPDISEVGWLEFLSHLGMLALMFVAGFELELDKLRRTWRACLTIGGASFLAPMAGVFVFAMLGLGLGVSGSLLVAVALSTTSLALVYHALKEHAGLTDPQSQIMLAAASVVDVLSMVSLALLLGDVGWGTAALGLAVVLSAVSLPRIGSRLFRRYHGAVAEAELRFLLVVLVAIGFMGESVRGMHPAIIAFTIGIAMSGVVYETTAVKHKLEGLVFGFFAPLFFIHAGTQVQLSTIDATHLGHAAILLTLAVGLKYIATRAAARWVTGQNGHRIGVLFNYRMTFGIIGAEFGLQSGVISQGLFDVLMLVILASAALPGLLLRRKAGTA